MIMGIADFFEIIGNIIMTGKQKCLLVIVCICSKCQLLVAKVGDFEGKCRGGMKNVGRMIEKSKI